jgi:hypothetical protein
MLTYSQEGAARFLPVGIAVIFIFLLAYTVLVSLCGSSKANGRATLFVIFACLFGIINGACLLYLSLMTYAYSYGGSKTGFYVNIPVVLFGFGLIPMTWMSGISVFSNLVKEKRSIQINMAYLLTFIQLILIISATAVYTVYLKSTMYYYYTYRSLYIAITALKWLYFLLFFSLVIQHRHLLSRLGNAILVVFGALNTIRLIFETAYLNILVLEIESYIFLEFFLTDFLSVISMVLLVTYYNKITSNHNPLYDN